MNEVGGMERGGGAVERGVKLRHQSPLFLSGSDSELQRDRQHGGNTSRSRSYEGALTPSTPDPHSTPRNPLQGSGQHCGRAGGDARYQGPRINEASTSYHSVESSSRAEEHHSRYSTSGYHTTGYHLTSRAASKVYLSERSRSRKSPQKEVVDLDLSDVSSDGESDVLLDLLRASQRAPGPPSSLRETPLNLSNKDPRSHRLVYHPPYHSGPSHPREFDSPSRQDPPAFAPHPSSRPLGASPRHPVSHSSNNSYAPLPPNVCSYAPLPPIVCISSSTLSMRGTSYSVAGLKRTASLTDDASLGYNVELRVSQPGFYGGAPLGRGGGRDVGEDTEGEDARAEPLRSRHVRGGVPLKVWHKRSSAHNDTPTTDPSPSTPQFSSLTQSTVQSPPGSLVQSRVSPGSLIQSRASPGSHVQSQISPGSLVQSRASPGSFVQSRVSPGSVDQSRGSLGSKEVDWSFDEENSMRGRHSCGSRGMLMRMMMRMMTKVMTR